MAMGRILIQLCIGYFTRNEDPRRQGWKRGRCRAGSDQAPLARVSGAGAS